MQYHLVVCWKFNLLHDSLWITLPAQSCLVFYSFCASLLHSFTIWIIVSSLSLHNLHLLICWVLSIFAFIWLDLMALFCTAISRHSVSCFRYPFLNHVHVFSCAISLIFRSNYPYSCFSSHFCFLVFVVFLSITNDVIRCYNWTYLALCNAVFESVCWCIYAIIKAGEFLSFFFS